MPTAQTYLALRNPSYDNALREGALVKIVQQLSKYETCLKKMAAPKPAPGGMRSPSLRSELKEQIAKDQGMLTLIPWREEMQERFEAADDGDGFITSSELGSLMPACGESLRADEVSADPPDRDVRAERVVRRVEGVSVRV